jgi:hypothetical protein
MTEERACGKFRLARGGETGAWVCIRQTLRNGLEQFLRVERFAQAAPSFDREPRAVLWNVWIVSIPSMSGMKISQITGSKRADCSAAPPARPQCAGTTS